MYKKLLLILLILSFSNLSAFDYDKYLKSETRAKIKTQKLVDDAGDYIEAIKFSQKALELYPNSVMIQQYRAKAFYLSNDLEDAKTLFMHILEIDPTNDIAADFISKIEGQEEAQKNKDLEEVLEYLADKGLDFLLIFLGFLGAEVLAKRFNNCENHTYLKTIDHYINHYNLPAADNLLNRIFYMLREYSGGFFTLCNFLSIIIIITISIAVTIFFTWLEFIGYINLLVTEEQLKTIASNELWTKFIVVMIVVSIIIVFVKVVKILSAPKETELDVADTLQELAINNEFTLLRQNVQKLNKVISENDKKKILDACASQDARDMIEKLFSSCPILK